MPVKNYVVEIFLPGGIKKLRVKHKSAKKLYQELEQQFPEEDRFYAQIYEFNKNHDKPYKQKVFLSDSRRRAARFVYVHKGRHRRGRKHYTAPKGGYRIRPSPVFGGWTERYSAKVSDVLKDWVRLINMPEEELREELRVFRRETQIVPAVNSLLRDGTLPMTIEFSQPTYKITVTRDEDNKDVAASH